MATSAPQAKGPVTDLAIHTLGWKAFQDLCAQVCAETWGTTVSVYREAQDGGQDAVFLAQKIGGLTEATVQRGLPAVSSLTLNSRYEVNA